MLGHQKPHKRVDLYAAPAVLRADSDLGPYLDTYPNFVPGVDSGDLALAVVAAVSHHSCSCDVLGRSNVVVNYREGDFFGRYSYEVESMNQVEAECE